MMVMKKGLVQIYTGDGKGKTSAAIGLAVRAAGAGLKVYMQQFIKGRPCSAIAALKKIPNIRVEQCGRGCFIRKHPSDGDMDCARHGLESARDAVSRGKYDVIILDEINPAIKCALVKVSEIAELIRSKPRGVELVLTGRDCPASIIRLADLVTEMKELKHPYRSGVGARRGIEY